MDAPAAAKSKRKPFAIFAVVACIAGIGIFFYSQYNKTHISTDDAYIQGHVHIIAPKVAGSVRAVMAEDNRMVKKGDLLVELDPVDYEVAAEGARTAVDSERYRLTESEAKVAVLGKQLDEISATVAAARANLDLARTNLAQAESDLNRAAALMTTNSIAAEKYERTVTARDAARIQVRAAEEALNKTVTSVETQKTLIAQAEASIKTQNSTVRQREVSLKDAELKSSYTRIYAPADGLVTQRSVETGNLVQAGKPMMAIVPLDDIWVEANYKETQITRIRPGMPVTFHVDTFPGREFKGKVDSIMAGTGAAFSLFPPENASGNYVKVVQRVPVKISIDGGQDTEHLLRVGMSVVPTVLVNGK